MSRRRLIIGAGAAFAAALAPGHGPAARPAADPGPGRWRFADDFAGPAGARPDPARWGHDLGGGGWGNGELQVYTDAPANAYIDGASHLAITAARQPGGGWTSARLTTQGRYAQTGGSWQARIKVESRPGIWPAFWLLGADLATAGWPACGEIDVMEDYGQGWTESTVHCPARPAGTSRRSSGQQSDDGWHVYQLDQAGGSMRFFRDGACYLTVTASQFPQGTWPFAGNGGMFALLNVAVGGTGPGHGPSRLLRSATLLVDWVRGWT